MLEPAAVDVSVPVVVPEVSDVPDVVVDSSVGIPISVVETETLVVNVSEVCVGVMMSGSPPVWLLGGVGGLTVVVKTVGAGLVQSPENSTIVDTSPASTAAATPPAVKMAAVLRYHGCSSRLPWAATRADLSWTGGIRTLDVR